MPEPTAASRHLTTLLVLAYLGFISLGLPDAVLGVAWPSLRAAFSLPQAALGAPLAALAVSYFLRGWRPAASCVASPSCTRRWWRPWTGQVPLAHHFDEAAATRCRGCASSCRPSPFARALPRMDRR
ncbi:hypothetical protein OV079_16045 [Nannocystis pusilla]|uniref:Uncharacterized protein n=1 Tax=Nannocystis pusilla TaxID=889268 RepID=A0A9X3EV31_9BACT|nr:hypothetical protein [Nannocystis pusilla]MCY1007041.1 hypothetical protein [Nannocystis pusilla]